MVIDPIGAVVIISLQDVEVGLGERNDGLRSIAITYK
jgi:hypothetical protein